MLDIAGHCWTKQEQTTISENGELFSCIQSWLAGKSPNFMAGWWYTYWKMMEFVSGDEDIPNWMESHKINVPNHPNQMGIQKRRKIL